MNLIFCFPGYHLGTYSMHTTNNFAKKRTLSLDAFFCLHFFHLLLFCSHLWLRIRDEETFEEKNTREIQKNQDQKTF